MSGLNGAVALITGASSGLGRACALKLAADGAAIVCADLRENAEERGFEADLDINTDALIRSRGGKAIYVPLDVRHDAAIGNAFAKAIEAFGRVDILVNVAGVTLQPCTILETSEDEFDFVMAVNAKGTFLCCKHAIAQMLEQEPRSPRFRGRIINFASMGGVVGMPGIPVYAQSKASVIGLTRQLAIEYAKQAITVNAVAPGFMLTAMTRGGIENEQLKSYLTAAIPAPRFGSVDDIARTVHFLAADDADFVTGQVLSIDGGWTAQ